MAKKESLSIVYEEPEGRPTIPVSGAFGSPAPDGSFIIAHLYSEFATIPAMSEHERDGDTIDLTQGNTIRRGDLTRKVLATLVFSPESAKRFAVWLSQKADETKAIRDQNPA